MNVKTIASAALLALAATCYMAPASAVPVLCENVNVNHMLVDSATCRLPGGGLRQRRRRQHRAARRNDPFMNAGTRLDGRQHQ